MNDLGTSQRSDAGPRRFTKIECTKLDRLTVIILGDGTLCALRALCGKCFSASQPVPIGGRRARDESYSSHEDF